MTDQPRVRAPWGQLLPRILDAVWVDEPTTVNEIAARLNAKTGSVGAVIRRHRHLFDVDLAEHQTASSSTRSFTVRLSAVGRRRHADEAVPF